MDADHLFLDQTEAGNWRPLYPPPPTRPSPLPIWRSGYTTENWWTKPFWQLNLWSCLTQLCLTKHVSKFRWKCAQPFESSFVFIGAERDSLHSFLADVFDQPVIKRLWTFGSLCFVSTVPYSTTDKSVCRWRRLPRKMRTQVDVPVVLQLAINGKLSLLAF